MSSARPKLDPRAVRKDLTSRECSRILAGMLYEVIRSGDVDFELARKTVLMEWRLTAGDELDQVSGACDVTVSLTVAGWKAGVWDMAAPGAVRDALRWWAQSDAGWLALRPDAERPAN